MGPPRRACLVRPPPPEKTASGPSSLLLFLIQHVGVLLVASLYSSSASIAEQARTSSEAYLGSGRLCVGVAGLLRARTLCPGVFRQDCFDIDWRVVRSHQKK